MPPKAPANARAINRMTQLGARPQIKVSNSKRAEKFQQKNRTYMSAKAAKSKKGSSITKSSASTNPNRPDPSGGKTGS